MKKIKENIVEFDGYDHGYFKITYRKAQNLIILVGGIVIKELVFNHYAYLLDILFAMVYGLISTKLILTQLFLKISLINIISNLLYLMNV